MGLLADPAHLDYVALSAHKMYAPFGSGALVARADTFAEGAPEYSGGGTVDFVGLDGVAWVDGPERDEAGSPNVIGAIAFAAAIDALEAIGMGTVTAHEEELTAHALARLARIPGIDIYGDPNPRGAGTRLGVIPFNVAGMHHGLVAAILSQEFGIGVRNGCFCAHPYLVHLLGLGQQEVSAIRSRIAQGDRRQVPGLVRASFGAYNTTDDVDALAEALDCIVTHGPSGSYDQDCATGDFRLSERLACLG